MTRDFTNNLTFTHQQEKFRRLLAEKRRIQLEKKLLTGLCLILTAVLGMILVVI